MKYLLFLLISISSFAQQKTTVKVNPSKDTTVITFTTTTTTTANTVTGYTTGTIPTVPPVVIPPDTTTVPPVTPKKYEGFGSQAVGGSQVVLVSNKAQFDAAMQKPSGKIITFTTNVSFVGRYDITNSSYFTIDGNGWDVTIDNQNNGDAVSFDGPNTHHAIITNIRTINAGGDGINVVDGAHDIMIDHCSSYDNRDGNIDVAGSNDANGKTKNVTIQYCFLGRGQGSDFAGANLNTGQNVTMHHNLYSPGGGGGDAERCSYTHSNYSPVGSPNTDERNNVIYGWGRYATGIGYKATGNYANNYYASNKTGAIDPNADPSGNGTNHGFYYVAGNVQLGGANINLNGGNHAEYIIPDPYKITMTDAKTAAQDVVKSAGTAKKNAYELSVINSIVIQ